MTAAPGSCAATRLTWLPFCKTTSLRQLMCTWQRLASELHMCRAHGMLWPLALITQSGKQLSRVQMLKQRALQTVCP